MTRRPTTPYQARAMTVRYFTCGAGVGQPCVRINPSTKHVPKNAARVHVTRVIAGEARAASQAST